MIHLISFQFLHIFYNPINSGAIQLDPSNIDSILGKFQCKKDNSKWDL